MAETRICIDCLQDLPWTDDLFYRHKKSGLSSVCKICICKAEKLRRIDTVAYQALKLERRRRKRLVLIPDHKICPRCDADKVLTEFREKSRGLYGRSSWCRICEQKYRAEYLAANRETVLPKRRKQWAESVSVRTEAFKKAARKRASAWYADPVNKARQGLHMRRYMVENYDKWRRRALRMKLGNLTFEQWKQLLEVHDNRCAYCLEKSEKLTMDHIIALSKGGEHTQDNVVPACKSCNSSKHDRPIWVMVNRECKHGKAI